MKKEKEVQEEKLKKERAERERLESELKAMKEADRKAYEEQQIEALKARKLKEEEERRAKSAPDREKLHGVALMIDNIELPEVSGEQTKLILIGVMALLTKVSKYIREESKKV